MKTMMSVNFPVANFSLKLKSAVILAALVVGSVAHAQSDFDSLGSNEGILKRARALNTSQEVRIVQKRAVDRDLRFEIGGGYGAAVGGNSYLNTQAINGLLEFHVNPKFSIGGRYSSFTNTLSSEGQSQFDAARAAQANNNTNFTVPDVDAPKSSMLGTLSYYPMYGKLNFFDLTVVQFDFYVIGGYGQMQLKSGSSATWTGGGGVGFWWNKYISSRLEIRYQAYQDKVYTGTRDVGMTLGTLGIGIML